MGDITNYIKGYAFKSASYQAKGNVLLVRASDLSSGTLAFLPDKKYLPSQFLETFKRYKLNQGDIVITTVGSKSTMKSSAVGRPIYINSNKPYLLNQNLVKITVNDSINSFYLYNQLLKSKYKYFVSTIERGNANQANITIHDLWKYKAFLTSELEEKQIGHLLLKLNQLFYLQQRKLEQLKQLKKAMLQQLFVDKNSKQPILRFKSFSGDWEQHKLKDISIIIAGGDKNKDKLKKIGNYPVIANAVNSDGVVGYYDDSYRIEAPAITVTGRGDIGHATPRYLNFTPVVRLLALKTKHDVLFLANAINKITIFNESTGVPQLTKPQLSKYSVKVTKLNEEKKISKIINTLNKLVTLQQNNLTQLTTLKKYLLQNLFV